MADVFTNDDYTLDTGAGAVRSKKRLIAESTGTNFAITCSPQADGAQGIHVTVWSGGATGPMALLDGVSHTVTVTAAGNLGVGTAAPDALLHASYAEALTFSAGSWGGQLFPAPGVLIDNPQPGGYDVGFALRQATSTGVLKPAWIVNVAGESSWNNGTVASQISSYQLYGRDNTGAFVLRFQIDSTGAVAVGAVAATSVTVGSAHGESTMSGVAEEEITLSTSGTTTDSAANLLPAGVIILAVTARITTTITTATDWSLGDATTAGRFIAAETALAAGNTKIGLNHQKGGVATDAAGPTQASAAKVRITTTGTPGAGKIRVCVHYLQFAAPTS